MLFNPVHALADADLSLEVSPDGWNALEGLYSFRYVDAEGKRSPLLLKIISASGVLLLHWIPAGSAASSTAEPRTLELQVQTYTTDVTTTGAVQ